MTTEYQRQAKSWRGRKDKTMTYTKQERRAYNKTLRERWQKSKQLALNDDKAKALHREAAPNMSYMGFYFTYMQMKSKGLDGLPHVDCKTYKGWKAAGFQVKRGEHATIEGITWIHPKSKNKQGEVVEDDDRIFPKVYKLFHRSQVKHV